MECKENHTEKAILEAALIEFADKGFTGSRTTEIARRAGVTHAMLHYYFRTKEMLFDKVVNNKIDDICSTILPVFTDVSLPLIERIEKGLSLHFDFLNENRKLPSLLFGIFSSGNELAGKFKAIMSERVASSILLLQKELDDAYSNGIISKIDAVMLLSDIVSLNAMPFIAWPMLSGILSINPETETSFLMQKKEENRKTILKRLQPSTEVGSFN